MSERSGVETLIAPAIRGAWGRAGRGFKACVAVGALLAVLAGAVVSAPAAGQEATSGDVEVRIVARKLESGRIEFDLQQRSSDDTWGDRRLPRVRFFPTTAGVGRWLASSALDLPAGEVRIVARKLTDGRIEFGLQQRDSDDTWGDRQLPRVRFFPTTARVGRWLASSPLTLAASPPGDRPEQGAGRQTGRPAIGYTSITDGDGHSCALHSSGTVDCWGANADGQAGAPAGRFTAVAAGGGHSCGLRTNSAIECWGYNGFGQADPPAGRFTAISAGGSHSCGLRTDGTIECWGYNEDGQADPPAGRFTAVSAGGLHSCGLRSDGTIACWGANAEWRVTSCEADPADGDIPLCVAEHVHTGQADPPAGRFTAVSAGWRHSCGLRSDGTIECWGRNEDGQADPPAGRFRAVSAGGTIVTARAGGHSCGLRIDGTIECWGYNARGQADAPPGEFTAVSAGGHFSCGIRTAGTTECWGGWGEGAREHAVVLEVPLIHGNTAQHAAASSGDPMELPGVPWNVRVELSESSRMVVHWKPPTTGGEVSYYFVDAIFSGEFYPPVDPRSVQGAQSFVSEVTNRLPARTIVHDGRENYALVIDYSVFDPKKNGWKQGGTVSGHGAVRVVAMNRDGLAVSEGATVPSERSRDHHASRALAEDVVVEYGDAFPWLDEAWNYITEREQSTDPRYNNHRSKAFYFVSETRLNSFAGDWHDRCDGTVPCSAFKGMYVPASRYYAPDLDPDSYWGSRIPRMKTGTVQSLAYVYTLSNDAPINPLAVVAGHLYFHRTVESGRSHLPPDSEPGDSEPGFRRTYSDRPIEAYAIVAGLLFREHLFASDPLLRDIDPYTVGCVAWRPPTAEESFEIGRSTLSGQVPQWFYDTYQNPDGSYNLDMLWRDVLALDGHARYFAIYALKDHFGGYCPEALHQLATGAVDQLDTGNPWRQGGCP